MTKKAHSQWRMTISLIINIRVRLYLARGSADCKRYLQGRYEFRSSSRQFWLATFGAGPADRRKHVTNHGGQPTKESDLFMSQCPVLVQKIFCDRMNRVLTNEVAIHVLRSKGS